MEAGGLSFGQFVLKVHSRCDLACTYCYVYEHADQSWAGKPRILDQRTTTQAAFRIAEHARTHGLGSVRVVLHGGEPLLLGPSRMLEVIETLAKAAAGAGVRLDLRIHTNGVLLDTRFLELFSRFDVKVGVSLDGGQRANDRHRVYRDGSSSYDKAAAALKLLRSERYRRLYAGLLCTIDIENDPEAVYRDLLEHEPPRIDLLLPHGTWNSQPPGLRAERSLEEPKRAGLPDGAGEYGAWLARVFDVWDSSGRPVPLRLFDSIIAGLHGRASQTESLGLAPVDLMVIETDGTIEQADSLKIAYDGAPATGFNVFDHDLDTAAGHWGFAARRRGIHGLSAQCRACPVVRVCGGGLYAHRFAPTTGFDTPSVYCRDLSDIIEHIQHTTGSRAAGRGDTSPDAITSTHSLQQSELDALGSGFGGADTVRRLGKAQQSLRRNLMVRIADSAPAQDREFARAWDLLTELDEAHPEAVNHVLAHPYVRAWAVECLRPNRQNASPRHLTHLAAITVSAALRAAAAVELAVPVLDSALRLPTFGALTLDPGAVEARVETSEDGVLTVQCGEVAHRVRPGVDPAERSAPIWQPVRTLQGAGLVVTLEDTDPFRDCHGHAAQRLAPEEWEQWNAAFHDAMVFIDTWMPAYSPSVRAGLTTIMPMVRSDDGTERSAANRNAYGAIGAARPDDPAILALLLVHEFQHVKLGAVLDLFDLYDPNDTAARLYAPWRPDPRPIEALLQGTYAHIAVSEFWRVKRLLPGSGVADEAHFARWRADTYDAVTELLGCGSLTPLGERFVRAMGETVAPWLEETVSADAQATARAAAAQHRADFDLAVKAGR
jgi:uncharacterized protein